VGPKALNRAPAPGVVLDPSAFISAILFRGPTSRLVTLWQADRISVLMSAEVLKEYIRVLSYPKFKPAASEIKAIIEVELLPYVKTVDVREVPPIIREDPSDDIFLALASAGKAEFIISGDEHLLRLGSFSRTKIVSPDEFLAAFPHE
jgi:putative PIN family toxin of toxin-antitoxin system